MHKEIQSRSNFFVCSGKFFFGEILFRMNMDSSFIVKMSRKNVKIKSNHNRITFIHANAGKSDNNNKRQMSRWFGINRQQRHHNFGILWNIKSFTRKSYLGVLGYLSMNFFLPNPSVFFEESVEKSVRQPDDLLPVTENLSSTLPSCNQLRFRCCSRFQINQTHCRWACDIVKPCANVSNTRRAIWASCKNEVLSCSIHHHFIFFL